MGCPTIWKHHSWRWGFPTRLACPREGTGRRDDGTTGGPRWMVDGSGEWNKGIATSNGIQLRSLEATSGSWPYY